MNDQELAAKIATIKNATVPLSISPKDLGEVLEALSGTTAEQPISLQEVLEFDTFGEFPMEGVANTIYINKEDDKMYRWSGTEYVSLNDSGTTITIRSLSELDTQQTVGVYTVLYIQRVGVRPTRTVVTSYTLRIESSPGFISQYMENKEGYNWREFNTNTSTWYDWQNVIFATTAYVDEAIATAEQPISLQEVLEFDTFGEFPMEGVANTIYINKDDDKMYRWSGTEYVSLNDSETTITIRSLNDLNSYQSSGVYACLYIQRVGVHPPRTAVTSYTLRIEGSSAMIMQFLENREGYRWRTYRNEAWGNWEIVVFATTEYVDNIVGDINTVLDLIITGE